MREEWDGDERTENVMLDIIRDYAREEGIPEEDVDRAMVNITKYLRQSLGSKYNWKIEDGNLCTKRR
ncbi:MAG: hypothetical protein SVY53_05155 [Chloroflexota bacterium]|nr:hypothetical protein [Chloroflexota bacterium]